MKWGVGLIGGILGGVAIWLTPAVIGHLVFVFMLGGCGYDLQSTEISPDGQYKAGVVEVNCGATTDYAKWALLTEADRDFNYKRDRLVAIEGRQMWVHWDGVKLIVAMHPENTPNFAKTQPAFVDYRHF